MYEELVEMENMEISVGIDCESGGGLGRGRWKGKNWDNCNSINNDIIKKRYERLVKMMIDKRLLNLAKSQ